MRLNEVATPTFARHETFHPRYGWFRKAFQHVKQDSRIFVKNNAPITIGVGKNMVRSIRFWGVAAKLIENDSANQNGRTSNLTPTLLGRCIFDQNGWDPYLEDSGTLWLLHWLILSPPCIVPVWWLAFNQFHAIEFTEEELETSIVKHIETIREWKTPHLSSLNKDVNVLIRTYAPSDNKGKFGIEDTLDCPLRELKLISRSAATNQYRFAQGQKPTLPPAILVYAVLDYVVKSKLNGNSISIDRLSNETGSPGKVFKVTEREILNSILPLSNEMNELTITTSTNIEQFSWSGCARELGMKVLNSYYGISSNNSTNVIV